MQIMKFRSVAIESIAICHIYFAIFCFSIKSGKSWRSLLIVMPSPSSADQSFFMSATVLLYSLLLFLLHSFHVLLTGDSN